MSTLILIPCEKYKFTSGGGQPVPPISTLQATRYHLLNIVANSPNLNGHPENQTGILNKSNPQLTPAHNLYQGKFFSQARGVLQSLAFGVNAPSGIHILIVSSFYGLVQINEGIADYEMDLDDKISSGIPGMNNVKDYWKFSGLHNVLHQHVFQNGITHVWSLLGKRYHDLFRSFWRLNLQNVWCCHVFPKGKGQASPYYRGIWLAQIVGTPAQLSINHILPYTYTIGADSFEYRAC